MIFFNFENFQKIREIEVFTHDGPVDIFGSIHTCAHLSSKWVNWCILVMLKWKYDDFLQFRKLFKQSKKLKFSPTMHGPVHIFGSIYTCAHFLSKWVNFLYFSCPELKILCFSSFQKLFKKWKKLKLSPNVDVDIFGSIRTCAHFLSKWESF